MEELFAKFSLNDDAQKEFKNYFEKQILNAFYEREDNKGVGVSTIVGTGTTAKDPKSTYESAKLPKTSAKLTKNANADTCVATKVSGEPCTYKAKENGYCGRHDPDKVRTITGTKTVKTLKKKEIPVSCNATINKTGKKCTQMGTVKPENANFHYCKRHSEKWVDFEQQESVDQLLYNEDDKSQDDTLQNETC
jgi:hypothetical protein